MAAGETLERPQLAPSPAPGRGASGGEPPLRIGLSARILHPDSASLLGFRNKTLYYLEASVAQWIMSHGALVFMIPTLDSAATVQRASLSMRDYVDALDGLVLQGGADVSPLTYGEEPRQPAWRGDRARDLYEIELLWEFIFQRKPVLGICRGAQLVNVAFNGTLYQDIDTEVKGAITHVDHDAYDTLHHDVVFAPGSRLAALYGGRTHARVTSIHHQAVRKLGHGLVIEARAAGDGVIEAIRWTGASYVLGVQWHPEFHAPSGSELLDSGPIIAEFLAEARRRKSGERAEAGAQPAGASGRGTAP